VAVGKAEPPNSAVAFVELSPSWGSVTTGSAATVPQLRQIAKRTSCDHGRRGRDATALLDEGTKASPVGPEGMGWVQPPDS
jgi:hypothetical protein